MSKPTISVNDVIDLAKSEPGLTPHDQRYLEALRAAWFTRKIGNKDFGRRLKKVISQDIVERIIQSLVPPSYYEQMKARAVAHAMIAMSSP